MKNKKIIELVSGNILMACAIAAALSLHDAVGGTSGLSVILSKWIPLPQTLLLFLENGALFLSGWFFVGFSFAMKSAGSVLLFPTLLSFAEKWNWSLLKDMYPVIAAVIIGMMLGTSAALVIDSGASTGGFDIPGIILEKKTGIAPSVMMCAGDILVILGNSGSRKGMINGLIIASICALTNTTLLHAMESGRQTHHFMESENFIRKSM